MNELWANRNESNELLANIRELAGRAFQNNEVKGELLDLVLLVQALDRRLSGSGPDCDLPDAWKRPELSEASRKAVEKEMERFREHVSESYRCG